MQVQTDRPWAVATDVGAVRRINEDACLARPEIGLFAVADGMGGHEAGDFASRTIMAHLDGVKADLHGAALADAVDEAVQAANAVIVAEAARRGNGAVIGSTLVVLLLARAGSLCLWAGDSRLYRFRDGALTQLTRDHSQVQDMVEAGLLTAAAAETHPLANVITRAVGTQDGVKIDRLPVECMEGDVFVVCSDGLSKMVPDAEIAAILARGGGAQTLVEAALAAGGRDNVTVIVVGADAAL